MVLAESPGSIKNQVGRSINAIRERVEQGDVEGVADQVAFLVAIAAPKIPPERLPGLQVPSVTPGRDRDGAKRAALFRACMQIVSDTLCILSAEGIYAWTELEVGDASGLALADTDSESGGEA